MDNQKIGNLRNLAVSISGLAGDRLTKLIEGINATSAQNGEIWECGCHRGGTALFMKARLMETDSDRILRAFDTFEGLPYRGQYDSQQIGTMKTDYEEVLQRFQDLSNCHIYKGVMPQTFVGLENSIISVAHIDVDQYQSVKECLEWIYPRVHANGWIVIDDYNDKGCYGAKKAVNDFLSVRPEKLIAPGGENPQAYFIKQ